MWQTLFFRNFIKKETLAQVFSCEFCETSKNTFFTEHLWTTASEMKNTYLKVRPPYSKSVILESI